MIKKLVILLFLLGLLTHSIYSQHDYNEKEFGVWKIKNGIFVDQRNPYNGLAKFNWKVFYNLFPKKISQDYIKEIVLFTDGFENKTGGVESMNRTNKDFRLLIDIQDVDFRAKDRDKVRQSEYTFIHEFGHLITLNDKQIKPSDKDELNENQPYITNEGEALVGSYLNKFVDFFWDDRMLKEWVLIKKKYCVQEDNFCLMQMYGFYGNNYNDFLTDYAADSPEEDIAESWTDFVLRRYKITSPDMVAHKKVNFFYNFPELVKYRKIIRKNLKHLNEIKYKL